MHTYWIFILLFIIYTILAAPHILFTQLPIRTHVYLQAQIGKQLIDRGYNVTVVSCNEFKNLITSENLQFVSLGDFPISENDFLDLMDKVISTRDPVKKMENAYPLYHALYPLIVQKLRTILVEQKPDLMVIDQINLGAFDVASELQIPYVVWSLGGFGFIGLEDYAYIPNGIAGQTRKDLTFWNRFYYKFIHPLKMLYHLFYLDLVFNYKVRKELGVKPYLIPLEKVNGHLHIITSFFGFEYPRRVSPLTHHVGMILPKKNISISENDKKIQQWLDHVGQAGNFVVYISFGTMVSVKSEHLMKLIKGITLLKNARILLAVRKAVLDRIVLPKLPKSVRLENWVNQRMVLNHPNVKVFVTHCGIQSIAEGIDAAVPMLTIPVCVIQ
jgi:2-hydroxyacylsphingosine 1-beta-galactosyltransferase